MPTDPQQSAPRKLGDLALDFRALSPADESFIFNSWLRAHRENGDWPGRLPSHRYYDEHKLVIRRLLTAARVLVASPLERAGQVLGYVVADDVLHWICVKAPFQGQGLAAMLLAEVGLLPRVGEIECSHWTRTAERLRTRWRLRYNPFLLG